MEVRRSVKSVSQPATAGILDEAARALSEHSPDGFVILGAPGDWTFTFVNAAAELLFGPANALIGRPFLNVFPESARSLVATALEAAYRTREPKDILAPHQPAIEQGQSRPRHHQHHGGADEHPRGVPRVNL